MHTATDDPELSIVFDVGHLPSQAVAEALAVGSGVPEGLLLVHGQEADARPEVFAAKGVRMDVWAGGPIHCKGDGRRAFVMSP